MKGEKAEASKNMQMKACHIAGKRKMLNSLARAPPLLRAYAPANTKISAAPLSSLSAQKIKRKMKMAKERREAKKRNGVVKRKCAKVIYHNGKASAKAISYHGIIASAAWRKASLIKKNKYIAHQWRKQIWKKKKKWKYAHQRAKGGNIGKIRR